MLRFKLKQPAVIAAILGQYIPGSKIFLIYIFLIDELGELKRVVNSLLQNVDSMSKDSLLLAATNHQQLLDSAVWRRFDYKLEIELPDKEAISRLIYLFINNMGNLNEKDVMELSTLFCGLSGAEIEELITKSIRNSIIHNCPFDKKNIYEE